MAAHVMLRDQQALPDCASSLRLACHYTQANIICQA
jgi:hypothetical protein